MALLVDGRQNQCIKFLIFGGDDFPALSWYDDAMCWQAHRWHYRPLHVLYMCSSPSQSSFISVLPRFPLLLIPSLPNRLTLLHHRHTSLSLHHSVLLSVASLIITIKNQYMNEQWIYSINLLIDFYNEYNIHFSYKHKIIFFINIYMYF